MKIRCINIPKKIDLGDEVLDMPRWYAKKEEVDLYIIPLRQVISDEAYDSGKSMEEIGRKIDKIIREKYEKVKCVSWKEMQAGTKIPPGYVKFYPFGGYDWYAKKEHINRFRIRAGKYFIEEEIEILTKEGELKTGTVRLKEVRCGKEGCKKCPHKTYAYAQYRVGKKVTEKYLGVAR